MLAGLTDCTRLVVRQWQGAQRDRVGAQFSGKGFVTVSRRGSVSGVGRIGQTQTLFFRTKHTRFARCHVHKTTTAHDSHRPLWPWRSKPWRFVQ